MIFMYIIYLIRTQIKCRITKQPPNQVHSSRAHPPDALSTRLCIYIKTYLFGIWDPGTQIQDPRSIPDHRSQIRNSQSEIPDPRSQNPDPKSCECVCVCVCACFFACACVGVWACLYVCVRACVCTCVWVWAWVDVYACVYQCARVCVCKRV